MRCVRESDENGDDSGEVDHDDEDQEEPVTTPTSYADDTLRAIAIITDKYDSFRRRQLRVRSFLASRASRESVEDEGPPRREDSTLSAR